MSSGFGFTSFSNLGSIVHQVQQVASQVSNQINQIDTGIQDVASNLEQAFKPSNHPERNTVNTPTEESNTVGDPDNSIPSSSSSDSENSRQRRHNPTGGQPDKPLAQGSTNSSSTSSPSTCSHGPRQTKKSETEGDFVYVEKPTSDEGYQEQTGQTSDPGRSKTSRLDLAARSGFSNPFGYLMGNGGLCGGRGDNKASGTSEANNFTNQSQSDQGSPIYNTSSSRTNVTDMAGKNSNTVCCDMCNNKFGIFSRKKTCSECRLYFCSNCIISMAARKVPDSKYNNGSSGILKVCARCQVLLKSPPIKADLMELRVKDLQRYLLSYNISMKDCVEKKDLVELVMKEHSGVNSSTSAKPSTSSTPTSNPTGRTSAHTHSSNTRTARNVGPVEREHQNFPRSYVQSTHRQDFFERFNADGDTKNAEEGGNESRRSERAQSSTSWMDESEENIRGKNSKRDNIPDSSDAYRMASDATENQPSIRSEDPENSFTPVEEFESPNLATINVVPIEDNVIEETPVEPMDISSLPSSPVKRRNSKSNESRKKREQKNMSQRMADVMAEYGQDNINQQGRDGENLDDNSDADKERDPSRTNADSDQDKATNINSDNSTSDRQPSEETAHSGSQNEENIEGAVGGLRANDFNDTTASKLSPSPKRFAKQDLVYIAEIDTLEELNELSVTQLKKLLAMNRVTFKGVVEKEELLKIVTRLWRQEQKAEEGKDSIRDEELCKICMDHPVDCVMLECGHMCTCTRCGKQMAECPICRQYVVRVVRTFKA